MSTDPLMLSSLEKVDGTELRDLRAKCLVLMRVDGEMSKFPGAQPVSFERKHLTVPDNRQDASILTALYFAAEKTDGVRYMLLVLGAKGTFVVDRNFEMRRLPPMRFPRHTDPTKPLDETLLDGELVIDTASSTGAKKRRRSGDGDGDEEVSDEGDAPSAATTPRLRYLAYDACCVGGRKCCGDPLHLRLLLLRRDVLGPRYALSLRQPAAFAGEHFAVELKDFFAMKLLPSIFSQVKVAPPGSNILYAYNDPLRKLSHGNDGIIFTPARDPYLPYTCKALLKWKPSNMNSIDFQLRRKWRKGEPRFLLLVADQTVRVEYDWITFSDEDHTRFVGDSKADTRIIECVWDPNWTTIEYDPIDEREPSWDHPATRLGGWRFERIREDKKHPNDIRTVKSVEVSVRDGVTAVELLGQLGIRVAPGALGAFSAGAEPAHGPTPVAPANTRAAPAVGPTSTTGAAGPPAPSGSGTE